MKKIMIVVTTLIFSLILTQWQIGRINEETLQDYTEVYVFEKALEAGHLIMENDITIGKINAQWFSNSYVTEKTAIIGKKLAYDVEKNTVVIDPCLLDERSLTSLQSGMGMTTLTLSPEASLCWQFNQGDMLSLYFVDHQGEWLNLGDVQVIKTLNSELETAKNLEDLKYVMIIAKRHVIEDIISKRELGRMEFVRIEDGRAIAN